MNWMQINNNVWGIKLNELEVRIESLRDCDEYAIYLKLIIPIQTLNQNLQLQYKQLYVKKDLSLKQIQSIAETLAIATLAVIRGKTGRILTAIHALEGNISEE